MSERNSLQKVFQGILSSQSFELLKDFSEDSSWVSLEPEEKELLAQLFLLSAEKVPCVSEAEQRKHSKTAYQAACRLSPLSARVWFRLGAFLALSEDTSELRESLDSLRKAVAIESRFFDAQYALGSVSLRLAILDGQEELLPFADEAFVSASLLIEESAVPADFYWHWGIVWSVIAKHSGEPGDLKKAIHYFAKAQALGCCRPDFFNDYANIVVELSLAISNDDLIFHATTLYTAAIEASEKSSEKEKSVRFFNLGCCYQHLFEATSEQEFFDKAHQAFEMTVTLHKDLFVAWQRWGFLLFRGWRIWRKPFLAERAMNAFQIAEKNGVTSPVSLASLSQLMLWNGVTSNNESLVHEAFEYAQKAVSCQDSEEKHPEVFLALALFYFERGKYFDDASYFEKALMLLQEGVLLFPRSAILWQAIATTKWAQADMLDDPISLRDSLVAYTIASRSFFAFSPQFWLDWGVALLSQAEILDDSICACDAIAKFERACSLAKDRSISMLYHLGRAFYFLADMHEEEEYFDRAIAIFTEAFFQDETFLPVLYHLASCYLHLGELISDKNSFYMAKVYYEELLVLDPEDELAWIDYALTLIHLGEEFREEKFIPQEWFLAEEALCFAQKLGQPFALYQKACLYTLMGNFAEAMESLYEAFDADELPELQDLLEDEWLAPLFGTEKFKKFLTEVEKTSPADKL